MPFVKHPKKPEPTPTYTAEHCYRCSKASDGNLLCDVCSTDSTAPATPEWHMLILEHPELAARVLFHDARQRRGTK
jgi:hypothetical protein